MKFKEKFPRKYLVWQCLDENGNCSDPFISTGVMNKDIYLNDCLKKIFLLFVDKYYRRADVLFSIDLATCHYATDVTNWLTSQNIAYVPNESTLLTFRRQGLSSDFGLYSKPAYKKRPTAAKNFRPFKIIWKNISREICKEHGQNLVCHFQQKLRLIGYSDVYVTS